MAKSKSTSDIREAEVSEEVEGEEPLLGLKPIDLHPHLKEEER